MLLLLPIREYTLPCEIHSNPRQGWQLWFVGLEEESMMLEADNISWLWIPPFREFYAPWSCSEAHTIWPNR